MPPVCEEVSEKCPSLFQTSPRFKSIRLYVVAKPAIPAQLVTCCPAAPTGHPPPPPTGIPVLDTHTVFKVAGSDTTTVIDLLTLIFLSLLAVAVSVTSHVPGFSKMCPATEP